MKCEILKDLRIRKRKNMALLRYKELRCVFSRGFASRMYFQKSIPVLESYYIPLNLLRCFFPEITFTTDYSCPFMKLGNL